MDGFGLAAIQPSDSRPGINYEHARVGFVLVSDRRGPGLGAGWAAGVVGADLPLRLDANCDCGGRSAVPGDLLGGAVAALAGSERPGELAFHAGADADLAWSRILGIEGKAGATVFLKEGKGIVDGLSGTGSKILYQRSRDFS